MLKLASKYALLALTSSMGNFDSQTQTSKLSNMSKQSRNRSTKIAIFSNHVNQDF